MKNLDKKGFINAFDYEDKSLIASIYEKLILCSNSGINVYTNLFLPSVIWSKMPDVASDFGVNVDLCGVFEYGERKMISFYRDYFIDEYPIKLLEIQNNSKFKNLNHGDFLGALMSLGIKREKLGDLVIKENSCYVPVSSDISDYITLNLERISNCSCKILVYEQYLEHIPEIQLEETNINVSSIRLDCIISALCNFSRSKAVGLLSSGKVMINYSHCYDKDYAINEGDIITIRGFGKYKMAEVYGKTQKDRLKVKILKFT